MRKKSTNKLSMYVDELQSAIVDKELSSASVSSVNIGWQIQHSLLVLNAVSGVLETANPKEFKKKFNLLKFVLFAIRRFPRGKAKSPKSVRPTSELSTEELEKLIIVARTNVSNLSSLGSGQFFKHPLFGDLRLKDTIRFLELHTNHHLKIIRLIQKSN
ncbi:MAG: DUF1569 domain-containing protein [Crocinitomicaceae bacterium]